MQTRLVTRLERIHYLCHGLGTEEKRTYSSISPNNISKIFETIFLLQICKYLIVSMNELVAPCPIEFISSYPQEKYSPSLGKTKRH